MNNKMSSSELKNHVNGFLKEHKQASLATTINNVPRTSPVEYFVGDNMNVYITSAGGSKFQAIENNPNVCMLVNTEFINQRQIKGVQIFGKAKSSNDDKALIEEAKKYSPEPYVLEDDGIKVIKVEPESIVYLDSIGSGDRTKQVLKNDEVTIEKDSFGLH